MSGGVFDYDRRQARLHQLSQLLGQPDVWKNHRKTQTLGREKAAIERALSGFTTLQQSLTETAELLNLAVEEKDEAAIDMVVADLDTLLVRVNVLETESMFSHPMDSHNAFLDINAGSGGTEAQDWAEMLLRMYLRWLDSHDNLSAEITSLSNGEVAGIKSVTVKVCGDYAYGWLRTETGVHRLVRKSPFDSGNRRHTSFASVFVSPEIDDDIDIDIRPEDLRIDVYRASGAGGQHVNKTESAVRITHVPSKTVVQCQNQRSQHKNKHEAMKQLQARLYEIEMRKKRNEQQAVEEGKTDISWGNQIRSYVLDQSRIKDLRTQLERSDTQAVLDGDLDDFIKASLKQGAGQ